MTGSQKIQNSLVCKWCAILFFSLPTFSNTVGRNKNSSQDWQLLKLPAPGQLVFLVTPKTTDLPGGRVVSDVVSVCLARRGIETGCQQKRNMLVAVSSKIRGRCKRLSVDSAASPAPFGMF